jgi:hypothetical protein
MLKREIEQYKDGEFELTIPEFESWNPNKLTDKYLVYFPKKIFKLINYKNLEGGLKILYVNILGEIACNDGKPVRLTYEQLVEFNGYDEYTIVSRLSTLQNLYLFECKFYPSKELKEYDHKILTKFNTIPFTHKFFSNAIG